MEFQREKFTFKYNGELEYIDFDTLYTSQLHFTEFIKELKETLHPDGTLKIKVKALPPGSFQTELALDIIEGAKTVAIFGVAGILGVGGFAGAINSIIDLYKNLKGKKPDKEETQGNITYIQIENATFEINSDLYKAVKNNPKIRRELSQTFDKIKDDSEVDSIEIVDKNGKVLSSVPRNNFQYFEPESIENVVSTSEIEDRILGLEDEYLSIFKVVFSKGFKWQFLYQGNKISADITDNDFLLKVMKGELSFSSGDGIKCKLAIHQKYNVIANAYENYKYTILKVNKHIPREQQGDLF